MGSHALLQRIFPTQGLNPEAYIYIGFPGSSGGKESTAMQETPVQFLGWEDSLEKE